MSSTTVVHESSVVTTEYPVFETELKWHLGAMRNLSEDWALGATVSLGTGSPSPLTGIGSGREYVGASAGSTVAVAGSAVLGAVALWVAHALSQTDF